MTHSSEHRNAPLHQRILVAGVYLAGKPNHIRHLVSAFGRSGTHTIVQRWAALGGEPPSDEVAGVTALRVEGRRAKFELLSELIAGVEPETFDYVILCDDDVEVEDGFVDQFIAAQMELGFAIAQPARTRTSFNYYAIVLQQPGLLARETRFIESGPMISLSRSAFSLVYPFVTESPMGWGIEYVWARIMSNTGLTLGIIDAFPIRHSLRPVSLHYDSDVVKQQEDDLFRAHPRLQPAEAHRVLRVYPLTGDANDHRPLLSTDWLGLTSPRVPLLNRARSYYLHHGWRPLALKALQPWRW